MEALLICTNEESKSLDVLLASLKAYDFNLPVFISGAYVTDACCMPNIGKTYGESFNYAMDDVFSHGYNSIIIANDDVVIRPDTYKLLSEDWNKLTEAGIKIGFLGTRSDWVMHHQNIRNPLDNNDYIQYNKYASENLIKLVPEIAPIFAAISREAWDEAHFPPTNWYSDNVISYKLIQKGFQHFVSRAYVHHIGSMSIGTDLDANIKRDKEWLRINEPELYKIHVEDVEKNNLFYEKHKKY